MHGYFAVAGALATFFTILGGANSLGMDTVDEQLWGQGPPEGDDFDAFGSEEVVEGHTTYAVLEPGREVADVRPPPDKEEALHCTQVQPGFVTGGTPPGPAYEDCYFTAGPIDPDNGNVVTDAYIEETTIGVSAKALEESEEIREKGWAGWLIDALPLI